MDWAASHLSREWERFHTEIIHDRNLEGENQQPNGLCRRKRLGNSYLTLQWETVKIGAGEDRQDVNDKAIFERVAGKFKADIETKKNPRE